MDQLLRSLSQDHADLTFRPGNRFYWSPQQRQIAYEAEPSTDAEGCWSLLHETAHALLNHAEFMNDVDLLSMEIAAWEKAAELAERYACTVINDYTQDCLDTYRDWLYRRSVCPTCGVQTLQTATNDYRCFNCYTPWRVAPTRLCRSYRLSAQKTARAI